MSEEQGMSRRERRALERQKKSSNKEVAVNTSDMQFKDTFMGKIEKVYFANYKQLLLIPFILLLGAFLIIGIQYATTGDFIKRGISLKGGIEITITSDLADIENIDLVNLKNVIQSNFPDYDVNVREQTDFGKRTGIGIEASFEDQVNINKIAQVIKTQITDIKENDITNNLSTIGSSLSKDFFKTAMIAVIIAFVFMAIVVFISFRTFAPSAAVVLAAFSDIVVTLAIFNILGYEMSTAGIAAFLMLIGYSVDTDILLSTRVLKRKEGSIFDRIKKAMKTGFAMTLTTLAAVIIGLIFATSMELRQIFTIILIGLLVDIVNTWIQNVGILRYYFEKKGIKK